MTKDIQTLYFQLNVGLERNDGQGTIPGRQVTNTLMDMLGVYGFRLAKLALRYEQSNTEMTAVFKCAVHAEGAEEQVRTAFYKALDRMSTATYQDCVAVVLDGEGSLVGPQAAKWGEFNPDYFINY